MALTYSKLKAGEFLAPDFNLKSVDGRMISRDSFKHQKGLLVIFMCNHCPYVIAVQDRIIQLAQQFQPKGIAVVGINSNDSIKHPDDSFENMIIRAKEKNYPFSYLWDSTQEVAKAYGAVCTPDPYLFETTPIGFVLRYQGRIDDNWQEPEKVTRRELAAAMQALLDHQPIATDQKPSMGCNIKWK